MLLSSDVERRNIFLITTEPFFLFPPNCICGVIVNRHTLSAVDRGVKPLWG